MEDLERVYSFIEDREPENWKQFLEDIEDYSFMLRRSNRFDSNLGAHARIALREELNNILGKIFIGARLAKLEHWPWPGGRDACTQSYIAGSAVDSLVVQSERGINEILNPEGTDSPQFRKIRSFGRDSLREDWGELAEIAARPVRERTVIKIIREYADGPREHMTELTRGALKILQTLQAELAL